MKKNIKDLLANKEQLSSYDSGYVTGVVSTVELVKLLLETLAKDCETNGKKKDAYSYRSAIPYVDNLLNAEVEVSGQAN